MESTQVPKSQLLTPRRLRQVLAALSKERGKPIVWTGVLVKMAGDHVVAAVLDQSLAWQRVKDRGAPDAWWWKTDGDWEAEIGVGRKGMTRARSLLAACGVEAEKRRAPGGNERVWHYRVKWEMFLKRLAAVLETTVAKIFAIVQTIMMGERETRKRRLAQVIRHVREVRSVPSGQFKPSERDSSNRPNGAVQGVPNGQVEVSEPAMTLIHLDSSSESSSGSDSGSQPPLPDAGAREVAAGVGVEIHSLPDMKNFLQKGDKPPGWDIALEIARHNGARDAHAYANGVLLRQSLTRSAGDAPVKAGGLAMSLDEFVVER